jgi:RHS repeat-associated protein
MLTLPKVKPSATIDHITRKRCLHPSGNALIRKDGETPLFDGQGSERTVTNSSQAVTGTLTVDGFGNQVAYTGSSSNPYQYAATSGYRNDGDAGLTHVGARYYDAQVGRFISRDTYLDQKPYLYCEHDPINAVDPSGHKRGWLTAIKVWIWGMLRKPAAPPTLPSPPKSTIPRPGNLTQPEPGRDFEPIEGEPGSPYNTPESPIELPEPGSTGPIEGMVGWHTPSTAEMRIIEALVSCVN